jgi:hypothetical protein
LFRSCYVVCLRALVCILFCFRLFSSCVYVFPTFEWVFYPPLSSYWSTCCVSPSCGLSFAHWCALHPYAGFHFAVEDSLLICSLSFGLYVCTLACLFICMLARELLFVLDRFHLHFPYFVYPLVFEGFVPSGTFYASAILHEPLVSYGGFVPFGTFYSSAILHESLVF